MRFRLATPQVIGGWEALTASLLGGVCRWVFGWPTNDNALHVGFGTHTKLQVWVGGGLYDITPSLAKPARLLTMTNPLSVTSASALVTVTDPGHQLETGDSVTISGSVAVGGITPNGTFTVVVVNASSYTYTFSSGASSTASGGGAAVRVQPPGAFTAGQIDGTGQAGYGTGPYGAGGYATPSVNDYFPRTWSGGAFGENLIASPRLGTIYQWDADDLSVRAAPLTNAPNTVTHCLVAHTDQVFALGCNEEASGEFNSLCIRHSSVRKATEWSTSSATTAREYILPGGGRIVAGRTIGSSLMVWTTAGLFLGTYVGQLGQVWRFDKVGDKCGLIGPGAAVILGQQAYWISPDRQFWSYTLGGEPQPMVCPIRDDFAENLSAAQADKIIASSVGEFGEVWWDYPDSRDGSENSRYVAVAVTGADAGAWFRGRMSRTARVDAGPAPFPLAVEPHRESAPYLGKVQSDADCTAALAEMGSENRHAKADWDPLGAVAPIEPVGFGSSGWGFRFSNGPQGALRVDGKTQAVNAPYSFSFRARTDSGTVTLRAGWRDATFNYLPGMEIDALFEVGPEEAVFTVENLITAEPSIVSAQWCLFVLSDAVPPGVTVDVTDLIMVEEGVAPAAWRPSPEEPNLFAGYGELIAGISYPQNVGRIYWHERGHSADGAPLDWFIESADQFMGEDRALLARAFWPDAREQIGPVNLTLATRFKPRGEERVKTYVFSAEDEKVDLRAVGRMFRLKLSGSASPSAFRLGRAVIDMTPTGAR